MEKRGHRSAYLVDVIYGATPYKDPLCAPKAAMFTQPFQRQTLYLFPMTNCTLRRSVGRGFAPQCKTEEWGALLSI